MINNKSELQYYLEADRIISGRKNNFSRFVIFPLFIDPIGKYKLPVTRSFGNFHLIKHGIISTPDIKQYTINSGDTIVVASTAIWDLYPKNKLSTIIQNFSNTDWDQFTDDHAIAIYICPP